MKMNKYVSTLIGTVMLLTGTSAHSHLRLGDEIGNGGGALLCKYDLTGTTEILFYDEYEARFRYDYYVSRLPGDQSPQESAVAFLEGIKKFDPELFEIAARYARSFIGDAALLVESRFLNTPDIGFGFIPSNCQYIQLIIQKPPIFPGDLRYWVDFDHWQLLTNNQKGIAIVHEVLYRHARETNPDMSSSEGLRHFVGLIISNRVSSLSQAEYDKWKRLAGILDRATTINP
ncbi:hypothetical protein [Bdellovibrio sp. BCCA]|uniref:hypothetical protein n=1 Tax=Bdellovibrio sp. BCCA TaxID=3136281 RepID=UPI0030F289A7